MLRFQTSSVVCNECSSEGLRARLECIVVKSAPQMCSNVPKSETAATSIFAKIPKGALRISMYNAVNHIQCFGKINFYSLKIAARANTSRNRKVVANSHNELLVTTVSENNNTSKKLIKHISIHLKTYLTSNSHCIFCLNHTPPFQL